MILLLTGGSGCGKSAFAERAISALFPRENRVYIATMRVQDEESEKRVERHLQRRDGMEFRTVEQPTALSEVRIPPESTVLLEDLPNLLANEMFGGGDPDRIPADLAGLTRRCANLIIVTNDVFSDTLDYDPSTLEYIRRLGEINRGAAALAGHVAEVVCGIPVWWKGGLPCL